MAAIDLPNVRLQMLDHRAALMPREDVEQVFRARLGVSPEDVESWLSDVGQWVAPRLGPALQGAASGAAAGSVVPGYGTAIGAGLGLLSGLLSQPSRAPGGGAGAQVAAPAGGSPTGRAGQASMAQQLASLLGNKALLEAAMKFALGPDVAKQTVSAGREEVPVEAVIEAVETIAGAAAAERAFGHDAELAPERSSTRRPDGDPLLQALVIADLLTPRTPVPVVPVSGAYGPPSSGAPGYPPPGPGPGDASGPPAPTAGAPAASAAGAPAYGLPDLNLAARYTEAAPVRPRRSDVVRRAVEDYELFAGAGLLDEEE